jgi:hypothetical protein
MVFSIIQQGIQRQKGVIDLGLPHKARQPSRLFPRGKHAVPPAPRPPRRPPLSLRHSPSLQARLIPMPIHPHRGSHRPQPTTSPQARGTGRRVVLKG